MQHCPICRFENASDFSFCGRCGSRLSEGHRRQAFAYPEEGQRRHLTVLFSDLAGYTAMCEEVDPEEVREVLGAIFAEIQRVVSSYDGFVFKLLGDSALILFGYPRAHEDDPVRAVRAALDIHSGVQTLPATSRRSLHVPLCMHSGLSTGLALIEWADPLKTKQEVTGDTVNLASRLCLLARPGEVLLDASTHRQIAGCFDCIGPQKTRVKGKTAPVPVYRVASPTDDPRRRIPLLGPKARLVGRHREMKQLQNALGSFLNGNKVVVEVCGGAGSGKTRLVQELKQGLDLDGVRWCQGYAYAYRDSIPYFPIIDLFKRLWRIQEDDPKARVKAKVETGCADLLGQSGSLLPYIGSLFSLDYPELDGLGPESWRAKFLQAVDALFTALARRTPLIVCLEDLHWADQECLNFLHQFFKTFEKPVLFLCVYRDPCELWPDQGDLPAGLERYRVRTHELSKPETMSMLRSLLGTDRLPLELERFVEDKLEGNPFYLTEVVNSLIESGLLSKTGSGWQVVRELTATEVPLTIQGLLSARIDRLDQTCKRILQEASVCGRTFLYLVLKQVTSHVQQLDSGLALLEQLDLIAQSKDLDDVGFVFKHALAQDVVYNNLLKRERRLVHEKIAQVIEVLFADRLHEFFETLAFHFKRAGSSGKAVFYLTESGRKSLSRHALSQAHTHYQEAMELVNKDLPDQAQLQVELLGQWAFVFYYRGCFRELLDLLRGYETRAGAIGNTGSAGMFFSWLGCALWHRERFQEAYQYLKMSLAMGEQSGDNRVVGYASAWLIWACADLGLLAEAGEYAQKAQQTYLSGESEFYVYHNSLAGEGYVFWHLGDKERALERGKHLIDLGKSHAENRCLVMGHCCRGWGQLIAGWQKEATRSFQIAVDGALDPWYALIPKLALCYGLIANARIDEAECFIQEILDQSSRSGVEFVGTPAGFFQGVALAVSGELQQGVRIMEETLEFWKTQHCWLRVASCSLILARIYSAIYRRQARSLQPGLFQKVGRIVIQKVVARRKAETLLEQCRTTAEQIGARATLGQACLELARIQDYQGKSGKSAFTLQQAVHCLEECGAEGYLQEARELQKALEGKEDV